MNDLHRITKSVIFAMIAALTVAGANVAHAQRGSSSFNTAETAVPSVPSGTNDAVSSQSGTTVAALNNLLAEWDSAGFMPPSKPSQYRVYGRNGYVTTGPDYNTMVSLIRAASIEIKEGRDNEASTKIARARDLLLAARRRHR